MFHHFGCVSWIHPGRPGWNFPYEHTTEFVPVTGLIWRGPRTVRSVGILLSNFVKTCHIMPHIWPLHVNFSIKELHIYQCFTGKSWKRNLLLENKMCFENSANAWGNYWILYHKTNKEDSTVFCSVVKHLGSGRALKKWGKTLDCVSCFPLHFFRALPLPACFTTEQNTVESSLFVKHSFIWNCLGKLCLISIKISFILYCWRRTSQVGTISNLTSQGHKCVQGLSF